MFFFIVFYIMYIRQTDAVGKYCEDSVNQAYDDLVLIIESITVGPLNNGHFETIIYSILYSIKTDLTG